MRLRATAIAAAVLACAAAGCGGADAPASKSKAAPDAVAAYKEIAQDWKYNDFQDACPMMSAGYQHKLLAEVELFDGDCRALVGEIYKQVHGSDAIKDLSIKAVDGPTKAGSVLVTSKVTGAVVRDRYDFEKRDGQWMIVGDHNFDATGPQAPVAAYKKAAGGDPEVLWSDVEGDKATVWSIEGNGHGSFTLWRHRLERVSGKWVLRGTNAVGTAPTLKYKNQATS